MSAGELERLSQLPIFAGKSGAQIEALVEAAQEKVLKHREVLFRAGDPALAFALVLEGALKLVKQTAAGDDVIVFFATPGNPVGVLLMSAENSVYPVTVIAMGPSKVLKVPKRTFTKVWAKDQEILQKVNHVLFARINDMHHQKTLTKAPLASKIAWQIVSLIERYGGNENHIIPIPITRQEIADSVGASVESVIRVMSEWSQKGVVRTTDQHIDVLKLDVVIEMLKGNT